MTPNRHQSPPQRCELLGEVVARFGGSVKICSSAESVAYALPVAATAELREFWRAESQAKIPPAFVARLPNGRVFAHGIVLSPDGTSIARDVSLDFGKPFESHWLLRSKSRALPRIVEGSTAVIATNLGTGYGHWLLDELPRLLMLPHDAADSLIAHATQPFSRVALAQWGWTGPVLPVGRSTHYQCEQLVVPSLNGSVVQPTRRGIDLVAEFVATLPADSARYGERLYISRAGARRRKVANEPALWTMLEADGFTRLRLEELSWPEQIAAFRQARIIVAPHGAGLANLVFCRPGTRVVELFNRSYVHGCFWRLAALQGVDYRPVVPHAATPLSQATVNNRLDIVADVVQVRNALR